MKTTSCIEPLEPRIAPATFAVLNLNDAGADSLRDAMDRANADPATSDTIVFGPGVTGTIPLASTIQIIGPVTIKGPGIDKLTIDGSGTTRAFFIQDNPASEKTVSLSRLSVIGGSGGTNGGAIVCFEPLSLSKVVISGGAVNNEGGGLWVGTTGKVTITDTKILNSSAGSAGGGMSIAADGGIVLTRCVVSKNEVPSAVSLGGGAVLDSLGSKGSIKINQSAFTNNDSGGAIAGLRVKTDEGRPISINKTTVAFNTADVYGGLYCAEGALTLANSVISHNEGATSDGGLTIVGESKVAVTNTVFAGNVGSALTYAGNGPLNVSKSQFLQNNGATNGGALIAGGFDVVTVSGSLFSGNSATGDGGAIYFTTSTLVLKGNTFLGNTTPMTGGAVAARGGGSITMTGGSFIDNSAASEGGAIIAGGAGVAAVNLSIKGTLFQRNSSGNSGGAMSVVEDASVKIAGAKFIENFSLDGGAIGIGGNTQTTAITGSFFRGNIADGAGGGVFFNSGTGLTIDSSRFVENQSGGGNGGGAIFTFGPPGTATFTKLIVTGNTAANAGGGIRNFGAAVTLDAASKVTGNFAPIDPNTSGL